MPGNQLLNILPDDFEEHRIIRSAGAQDPLGFLKLVEQPDAAQDEQLRNRPNHSRLDRIRNDVNRWLEDADFGGEDISGPAPAADEITSLGDATANTHNIHEADDNSDDVSEVMENSYMPEDDDNNRLDEDPDLPPDPVALNILHTSEMNTFEDSGFSETLDEVSVSALSSETLRRSIDNDIEELPHEPEELKLSAFHNALAVWEYQHQISRSAHAHLVEVFQLADSLAEVHNTPKRKDTLRSSLEKTLPLGKLQKRTVKLDTLQLPTGSKDTEEIFSFDLLHTLTTLLSSDNIYNNVYRGMAHLIDGVVQNPWEAPWWGESVRTTSGQFHRYPNGSPIFPSDFVIWSCKHNPSLCTEPDCKNEHLGRVKWAGEDHVGPTVKPLLLVQRVYGRKRYVPLHLQSLTSTISYSRLEKDSDELYLLEDSIISLRPEDICSRLSGVELDYDFCPRDATTRTKLLKAPYTVRYLFNSRLSQFRPLRRSSPHRAELEIKAYSREHFETNFTTGTVISLPLHVFVDAFGLYRNMYRSIMGVYFIAQFFQRQIRTRRSAVFTATLGPFGASEEDILKSIFHISGLDRGIQVELRGVSVYLCSFVGAILGDMPSQQLLSGCLGVNANFPCRYCEIRTEHKHDLLFNSVKNGRYHYKMLTRRHFINESVTAASTKKKKLAESGLHDNNVLMSTLTMLFPALDLIRSRPADAAHSEYKGLSRLIHKLIFQDSFTILTARAADRACTLYQHFKLPPGWSRLQSPRTHLDSYGMQEFARGAVVLPIFLRSWLRDDHIKKNLHPFIKSRARDHINCDDYDREGVVFTVADWIVIAVWTFARSVMATCGEQLTPADRENLPSIIIAGRKAFQFLCQVQSDSVQMQMAGSAAKRASRAQRNCENGAQGRTSPTPARDRSNIDEVLPPPSVSAVASARRRQPGLGDRSNQFSKWKCLPNVHIGLHLPEVAAEYGSCAMVFTLLGEDKHRQFKSHITQTNHRHPVLSLIKRENMQQTLQFLFAGCFEQTAPHLHAVYQNLSKHCPGLANALNSNLGSKDIDGVEESYLDIQGDREHTYPRALHGISNKIVSEKKDDWLNVVTTRELAANTTFLPRLQAASEMDYCTHFVEMGRSALQWSQKAAFTDTTGRRRCFQVGDFAQFRLGKDRICTVAQIDGIFAHQRAFSNKLYFVVSFAVPRSVGQTHDAILRTPIYELSGQRSIIGLPRLCPDRIWMVDIAGDLMLVDHDVYFM